MIFYDFEVFKYDWLVCFMNTKTQSKNYIVNDSVKLKDFYKEHKNEIWVGYNSRTYDQYILKAILCGFNPYEMSDWIINKKRKGFEFSKLLANFPLLNYDCAVGFKSLKELEAFMGHNIKETSVPFNIDRKLTKDEIKETLKYCFHDVQETMYVFLETKEEWDSHYNLIKEFNLPIKYISKTKAQISAIILDSKKVDRNDEFKIDFADTVKLGKYSWLLNHYLSWSIKAVESENPYDGISLDTIIAGVPHKFGVGGLHGAINNYIGDGYYIMCDVGSYYPALMIEYDWLSRNVKDKHKFKKMRDERIIMKQKGDPRQYPRKIVLNGTFGASKDKFNNLYDPKMANNVCINGQLLLVDLIEKLEGKCQLIQSNTDGILIKLYHKDDYNNIISICQEWCQRTRMDLEYKTYSKVFQKDVNNYILVDEKGKLKSKGSYVKKLSNIDNQLPIVNKAVVNYFVYNIPVEKTINESNNYIDFQIITKAGDNYNHVIKEDYDDINIVGEKINRVFASKNPNHGGLYKKHKDKTNDKKDKIGNTPECCFIDNENILDKPIPKDLDKQWYIDLAKKRINEFKEIKEKKKK